MKRRRNARLALESLESRHLLTGWSGIVISEIMYHPSVSAEEDAAGYKQNDFEFIELHNSSTQPVNLQGLAINGEVSFQPGAVVLAPDEYVVVANKAKAIAARYGSEIRVLGEFKGSLSNSQATIQLVSASGIVALEAHYQDTWQPATDGDGNSLVTANSLGDAENWQSSVGWMVSSEPSGSPGRLDNNSADPQLIPRDLAGVAVSSRHVDLSWTMASNAISQVAYFKIYRDDKLLASSGETRFRDATAGPNQIWTYSVASVNSLGIESAPTARIHLTIPPVGGTPEFTDGDGLGDLMSIGKNELSGMAASRVDTNLLWVNNDGSSSNSIYAIDTEGQFLAEIVLTDVQGIDWEDIAVGPVEGRVGSFVFVGDIGDNQQQRESIAVYRFEEPVLPTQGNVGTLIVDVADYDTLELIYPDGAHDAEVLLVDPISFDLFVVAKQAKESGVYRATSAQMATGDPITLTRVATAYLDVPSGGDIAPDGSEIVLRNEDRAIVLRRGLHQTIAEAFGGIIYAAPVIGRPTEPNGEAIAYRSDNGGYFTVSEGFGPELYYFDRIAPYAVGDANHDGRFSSSDLVLIFQAGRYDTNEPALFVQGDWNGDGVFDSSDLVSAFQSGGYES